ncbi:MAG: phosphate transport system substrate-binding protein [Lysobacterales bacterium]|jgi:phosphate transport system substrate-binding protein
MTNWRGFGWPAGILTAPFITFLLIMIFTGVSAGNNQDIDLKQDRNVALVAVGADSMAPMMQCWIASFTESHPDVSISFKAALSADGAVQMLQHRADFSPFAREFFPLENEAFQDTFGEPATLIPVATGSFDERGKSHALAIWVHKDNPLVSLSLEQLRHILTSRSDELTWADAGLTGEWASRPINRFGMLNLRSSDNPPGIVNFMRHRVNGHRPLSDEIQQLPGDEAVHALQQIVDSVAKDPLAIGYSGFRFSNPGSKTVPISFYQTRTAISGSAENVRAHRYPLSRFVYLALSPELTEPKRTAVTNFVEFTQSQAGQDCPESPPDWFYPLQAEVIAANKAEIDTYREPGSGKPSAGRKDYLTSDGKIRVVGYNDMEPMLVALNALFKKQHPDVSFDLKLIGTRAARPALIDGSSAFAPMGAEFSAPALEQYRRRHQSDPLAIKVAHAAINSNALSGPLAIFVHEQNPLTEISLPQAEKVFSKRLNIENLKTWGQLGLSGPWKDRAIEPCGLRPERALSTFLSEHFFSGAPYVTELQGFAQSTEAVEFASMQIGALCFAAYNRAASGVKALKVSAESTGRAFSINEHNIINHHYPLVRHLYIYLRNIPGFGIDSLQRDYIEMILSPAGQELISTANPGYLPLSQRESRLELRKLSQDPVLLVH